MIFDPLGDLQEKVKVRLESMEFFSDSQAATPRPIPVVTEKLGNIESRIDQAVAKIGACALVTTPIGDLASADNPGLIFEPLDLVVRVFENVTINRAPAGNYSKQPASWIALAVAWRLQAWTPAGFGGPVSLNGIALVDDPKGRLAYDIIGKLTLAIGEEPQRLA